MVYHVKGRYSIFVIILIAVLWGLYQFFGKPMELLFLMLLPVVIMSCFRFKVWIHNQHLEYEIMWINKTVYKKGLEPSQIKQMKFSRIGWARKAAILKRNKGFNIKLVQVDPPNAYEELAEFAENHQIETVKTKEYVLLEKMK